MLYPLNSEELRAAITANGAEVERLRKRIRATYRVKERSDENREQWQRACEEFHSRFEALAFPGGYSSAVERLQAGDTDAIEAALCFVEVRPFYFRSGYLFKALLPKLKRCALTRQQAFRLDVVLERHRIWQQQKRALRQMP